MSAAAKEEDIQCCANCGIARIDDIKLKDCSACHLVKYCSVKCQKEHWPQHKKECKKRAAELKDEILFEQPESSCYGDCPICCLPVSIDEEKTALYLCCCNYLCNGCNYSNQKQEFEARLQVKCPFCRKAIPKTKEENKEQLMKRIGANDPVALCYLGEEKCEGGDYNSAFEYLTRAAALGNADAHYQLSILHRKGKGVEKDEKREQHHLEQAAIRGHPRARNNLGCMEGKSGRMDRAAKHWIIAANLGYDPSLENLKKLYKGGHVSKDDFAAALRAYQAAIDATKSPQREEAYEFIANMKQISS